MRIRVIDPAVMGRTWTMRYVCLDCGNIVDITEMTLAEYQRQAHQLPLCPACAARRDSEKRVR